MEARSWEMEDGIWLPTSLVSWLERPLYVARRCVRAEHIAPLRSRSGYRNLPRGSALPLPGPRLRVTASRSRVLCGKRARRLGWSRLTNLAQAQGFQPGEGMSSKIVRRGARRENCGVAAGKKTLRPKRSRVERGREKLSISDDCVSPRSA